MVKIILQHRKPSFIPGLERSPGAEHGNSLQYSYLENSMDRGVWLQFLGFQESNTVEHAGTHSGVLFTLVNALCGRARPYNTYMLNFLRKLK